MKQASQIELIKLANELDKAGHSSLANRIDRILKLAQAGGGTPIEDDGLDEYAAFPADSYTEEEKVKEEEGEPPARDPMQPPPSATPAATEPAAGTPTEPAAGTPTEPAAAAAAEPAAETPAEPAAETPAASDMPADTYGNSLEEYNGQYGYTIKGYGGRHWRIEGPKKVVMINPKSGRESIWTPKSTEKKAKSQWSKNKEKAPINWDKMIENLNDFKNRQAASGEVGSIVQSDNQMETETDETAAAFGQATNPETQQQIADATQTARENIEQQQAEEAAASPGAATGEELVAALRRSEGGDKALQKARTHVGRQLRYKTTKSMGGLTNPVMRPERQLRLAQEALQEFVESKWTETAQQQQAYQMLLSQIENNMRTETAQPQNEAYDDLFAESSERFDNINKVSDLLGREFSIGVTPLVRR
ncbi:hypothetical protein CMI47_17460 [Candidatus Pacearchaeota archaeon]|nr:hypothetical protein [Candidatus Pacearchaeota archaeon]